MKTLHLFAGGGGGLLADLILGHTPVAAVEIDPYCCEVLRVRSREGWFPGLTVHEEDVRQLDAAVYAGRVDCIHAGFPCQDVSPAGRRAGVNGGRSGLYREVLRVVGDVRPGWVFMENSSEIVVRGLDAVAADFSTVGFAAEWDCISAEDVGAWHIRDRWWFLAKAAYVPDPYGQLVERWQQLPASGEGQGVSPAAQPQPGMGGMAHGLADRLDWWDSDHAEAAENPIPRALPTKPGNAARLKALGNGQVPLCAAVAFTLLMKRFQVQ